MIQPDDPRFHSAMTQWWLRICRTGPAVYDLEPGTLDPVSDWQSTGPERRIYAYPTELWELETLLILAEEFEQQSGRPTTIASALQITHIINPDIIHEQEIPGLYLVYIGPI